MLTEIPTAFTVRDWHPTQGNVIWKPEQLAHDNLFINGWWGLEIARAGWYAIRLSRHPDDAPAPMGASAARVQLGETEIRREVDPADVAVSFELQLAPGPLRLQTWLTDAATGKARGAYHVEARLLSVSDLP